MGADGGAELTEAAFKGYFEEFFAPKVVAGSNMLWIPVLCEKRTLTDTDLALCAI